LGVAEQLAVRDVEQKGSERVRHGRRPLSIIRPDISEVFRTFRRTFPGRWDGCCALNGRGVSPRRSKGACMIHRTVARGRSALDGSDRVSWYRLRSETDQPVRGIRLHATLDSRARQSAPRTRTRRCSRPSARRPRAFRTSTRRLPPDTSTTVTAASTPRALGSTRR
jgi:hypothetical protein